MSLANSQVLGHVSDLGPGRIEPPQGYFSASVILPLALLLGFVVILSAFL